MGWTSQLLASWLDPRRVSSNRTHYRSGPPLLAPILHQPSGVFPLPPPHSLPAPSSNERWRLMRRAGGWPASSSDVGEPEAACSRWGWEGRGGGSSAGRSW
jgi:hypothetical protein